MLLALYTYQLSATSPASSRLAITRSRHLPGNAVPCVLKRSATLPASDRIADTQSRHLPGNAVPCVHPAKTIIGEMAPSATSPASSHLATIRFLPRRDSAVQFVQRGSALSYVLGHRAISPSLLPPGSAVLGVPRPWIAAPFFA